MSAAADDRTRLTAVPRALSAVWRVLRLTSQAMAAVARGLVVDIGVALVVFAVYREDGHLLGIGAAGAWVVRRISLFVRDRHIRAGRR